MEILILTGMSGAGKTHAANALEDLGYYCVDNMPAVMLLEFTNIYKQIPNKTPFLAFIIDVRGTQDFDVLSKQVENLKIENTCRFMFLDCADEVIITRYKETRRIHPLTMLQNLPMREAIAKERELLQEIKQKSDFIVDTTKFTSYQLKERITSLISSSTKGGLTINCMSFGFKYGIPSEADLVFDVRCFPNPFYVLSLRDKNGLDVEVADYILSHKQTADFIDKLKEMIDFLLPLYTNEGISQLIISIGCTGGKHRSVCISEILKKHLLENNYNAVTVHRDMSKA